MSLKVERDVLDRIVAKYEENPLTTDFYDELRLLKEVDLNGAAAQFRNLKSSRVRHGEALRYGRDQLPVFMEAKFAKVGGALVGLEQEGEVPSISWAVMDESWAVGTYAAMSVVEVVAKAQDYRTHMETAADRDNEWHRLQWRVELSFR